MPAPQWPLRTETRFGSNDVLAGRYRLDALLGRGGAADVYGGFDLRLRRPVAVKVFRLGTDAQTEERFTEEAVMLAGLQHPGLVTVFDSGREAGSPFLVMQLVTGATLRARVAGGALTPAEACTVGAALADALDYVHAAGVVHRDVKPSNILLDGTGAPHLTDFGISRLMDSTTQTATGALVGTAAYLAPEQVMGRPVGPPADVYALGLTLLECLKGELEYDGAPLEAAIARLHRAPVFPSFLGEELAALLAAMTALDEDERPDARTCADMLSALGAGERPAVIRTLPPRSPGAKDGHDTARVLGAGPGTRAADGDASPVRHGNGRALATAGAALATLLGVTLAGVVGLPDHGAAAGPDSHASSSAGTESSDTSAAAPAAKDAPASRSASVRPRTQPVTSAASAASASASAASAPSVSASAPRENAVTTRQVAAPANPEPQAESPTYKAPKHKAPKHKAPKKEKASGKQKANK
ncbi:serine/threonine-protein kinase [Streptomyces sp. NPDC005551]|uniref:serine/threonine-protein kinase n=1 Tax=unclassified Streptomyces TaxID=2593676 RepID=UPI0033FEE537